MSLSKTSIKSQQNFTEPNSTNGCIYEFEDFRLDAEHLMLYREGKTVDLKPKVIETLVALVERAGNVISNDELMTRLWADSFVEESNLTQNIYLLRKTLGNCGDGKPFIENFSRRGYRFNGEVKASGETELILATHTKTHTLTEETIEHEEIPAANRLLTSEQRMQTKRRFWTSRSHIIATMLILTAAVAGIGYLVFSKNSNQPTTVGDGSERTLAVLPFKLLNPADRSDYLSVGLADSLITKLSNVRSLTVRPTSAVMRYAPNEMDAVGVGRELKVETVIDGSVQRADDRVRVTVQLIRVSDGKPLWANTYDARFVNIFQVEDEISTSITEALKIQLSGEEQARLTHRPTDNIQAYQLYLRGNYHLYKYTSDDLKEAFRNFNEAIALDPTYALAYAGLANAYGISSSFGIESAAGQAEVAALKAVELDPTLSEAHAALAVNFFWHKHDTDKAQVSFDRALQLNPNSAITHHYYAWFLIATGRFDQAEQHLRRALELDPLSPSINVDQGLPFFFARRYTEARTRYEQALKLDANFSYAHLRLGEACEGEGDFACAIAEFERTAALPDIDSTAKIQLARTLALAGKTDEASRLLKKLTAKRAPRASFYYLALVYAALDDIDAAFAGLERALAEKDKWLEWAKVDPRLDALRKDARFDDFLRRTNLK